jgi:hypothetical protein
LDRFYEKSNIPHFYHIKNDSFELNVINLLNKKHLLISSDIKEDILTHGLVPLVFKKTKQDTLRATMMRNLSSYFRPYLTFERMGWNSEFIPIGVILSDLNAKLIERIVDNTKRNLSYLF